MGQLATRSVSENRIQQEIHVYHWNNYPAERGLLFHVNNSAANRIQGARLRSMGMVAGVCDMIYLKPGGRPILMEIKNEAGRQSARQANWQQQVNQAGYIYALVRSLEEAKTVCGWN